MLEQNKHARLGQLDALRGIAAVTVVLSHLTLLGPLLWLRKTPLRVILGGHEAVVLFFVLSGFVLALQASKRNNAGYGVYLFKRVTRIYLPYLACTTVALALYKICYRGDVAGAGDWFNAAWGPKLTGHEIAQHYVFLLPFQSDLIVPVIWSLVYEMRISIVFPLMVYAVLKWPAKIVLPLSVALSIGAFAVGSAQGLRPIDASVSTSWLMTLHYQLMFIVGALAAVNLRTISALFGSKWSKYVIVVAGVFLYFFARFITYKVPGELNGFSFDWILTVGSVFLIIGAVVSRKFASILEHPVAEFLGRISYSIYLFHAVVLFSVIHLLGGYSLSLAITVAGLLVIPVAYLGYRFVELPSIRFGRILPRKRKATGATTL